MFHNDWTISANVQSVRIQSVELELAGLDQRLEWEGGG